MGATLRGSGDRLVSTWEALSTLVKHLAGHAGHADILRELVDGKAGPDHDDVNEAGWRDHLARVYAAADRFRPGAEPKSPTDQAP